MGSANGNQLVIQRQNPMGSSVIVDEGASSSEPPRKKIRKHVDEKLTCPIDNCPTLKPVSRKKGNEGTPLNLRTFHNGRKLRDHLEKKHDRSHPEFFPLWAATFENADEAEKAWERRVKKHGPDYIPRPNVKLPE